MPVTIYTLYPAVDFGWEQARLIRNECRKFMTGSKAEITPEMQETFRANFDPKSQRLYLIGDPVPFGYLYLVRDGSDWLATYGIMEERRGEGHGTTLVLLSQALLRRIKIWVARSNGRARRIYERLGFVAVAGDLWNQQMVWNRRTP